MIKVDFWGVKMISLLHKRVGQNYDSITWGGMPKWLQYYIGGWGVSRDPQKWLRNMCTTPNHHHHYHTKSKKPLTTSLPIFSIPFSQDSLELGRDKDSRSSFDLDKSVRNWEHSSFSVISVGVFKCIYFLCAYFLGLSCCPEKKETPILFFAVRALLMLIKF